MNRFIAYLFALLAFAPAAFAKPPLEAFGDAPSIRMVELSPDGSKLAFVSRRSDGTDVLVVSDFDSRSSEAIVGVDGQRTRGVTWIGEDNVVLTTSDTRADWRFVGRFDMTGSFVIPLATRKPVQLLRLADDIYPAQSGLGRFVGVDPKSEHVYMPAYVGPVGRDPLFHLLKVEVDSGRAIRSGTTKGSAATIDWLVDGRGEVVAREDFNKFTSEYRILVRSGDDLREIYKESTSQPTRSLVGTSARTGRILLTEGKESAFLSLFELDPSNGTISGPVFARPEADVEGLISDRNRVIHGVRYSGVFPSYEMFDPTLNLEIKAIQSKFQGSAVLLTSWADDWSRLLFYTEGGVAPPSYWLFDRTAKSLKQVAFAREQLKPADIAEVSVVEYKARDGLTIPSLVTWPVGVAEADRKNLPMIVMPHGGPEAYDSVGFDWLAQFLANEGYVVLQPNFRGSDGFGTEFRLAGQGEWGRKMQDDVSDGAMAMAKMGWVDRNRVCIVGWSYGGYSALAGGALTPDLYRCVVSVAGVADLRSMLDYERDRYGEKSRTYAYWRSHIGDPSKDREKLDEVSPTRLADAFKAPVLLVHGTDDLVVPASQSDRLENALKAAGKEVSYLKLRGDDHGLFEDANRRQMLEAVANFLGKHLAVPASGAP